MGYRNNVIALPSVKFRAFGAAQLWAAMVLISFCAAFAAAQEPVKTDAAANASKKANARPPETTVNKPDPFDGAAVEEMASQCVTLETQAGAIEIEMLP